MGQCCPKFLRRRRGSPGYTSLAPYDRTVQGMTPTAQCTDDLDFTPYGYPLANLTPVNSDCRDPAQEELETDSLETPGLSPKPEVVSGFERTPRQAESDADTAHALYYYKWPIPFQFQQQPEPSSHDQCIRETSFTTHHVKATSKSESTLNLHLHQDDEPSCTSVTADESSTTLCKPRSEDDMPTYHSNPSKYEHVHDHHFLRAKSLSAVACTETEDTWRVPVQKYDSYVPSQIDSLALSPELTTPYLDQNTLNQFIGPDHDHSYSMLPPAMQDLPTQLVTSTTFFEIEGEQVQNKLREISNYTDIVSTSCDHNGGIIISKDGDLKLIIPRGAIKEGDSVKFFIATSLFDPFVLHDFMLEQNGLASPYYHIITSKFYRFYKPVQVEFQCFAVPTACDPSHYQLQSCEDDDESHTMRPVDYALNFSDISWCTFQTDLFCSYCLLHTCTHPIITRIGAFFLKPKNFQSLDKFTVEVWFSFLNGQCLKRNEELYTRRGMILDKDYIYNFDAASDKKSTNYFELLYDQWDDGWNVSHNGPKKIYTRDINFYNYYSDSESLKKIEELRLFPPHFILEVEKTPGCTNNLNRKIRTILFKTDNTTSTTEPVSFKLYAPTLTTTHIPMPVKLSITDSSTYIPHDTAIPLHRCAENRPQHRDIMEYPEKITHCWEIIAYKLGVPKHKIRTINIDHHSNVKHKCIELFNIWLDQTDCCWCHFIQALNTVGLYQVADEAKAHLKAHKVEELALAMGATDLYQLEKFLNHVPNQDLNYFVFWLLPHDGAVKVLKDIRQEESKEDKIKKVCHAFSKEKGSSWTRVHKALTETKCYDLAEIIEASFL